MRTGTAPFSTHLPVRLHEQHLRYAPKGSFVILLLIFTVHVNMRQTGGIYRTTYGPEFYKSFSNFASSTKFTVPLNLGNDTLDIALDQAQAAYRYLNHDKIWAFECKKVAFLEFKTEIMTFDMLVGNEPGNYKATQRNLSNWGADAYVAQWQVSCLPMRRKESGFCSM